MSAASDFRAALASGDVQAVRKASAAAFPHLPQPKNDGEAEALMHVARTETESLPLKLRAWSHRWLTERNLPSHLPDVLKPKAERLYPVIAEGVLVAATARTDYLKPAARIVQRAMCDAVEDCYANGDKDPAVVRARMEEVRARTFRELLLGAH